MARPIVETIRKLLRLERSDAPEATRAGARARLLMERYRINVTLEEEDCRLPMPGVAGVQWRERLASAIAKSRNCRMQHDPVHGGVIVGTRNDATEARLLYERTLAELVVAAQVKWTEYAKECDRTTESDPWLASLHRRFPRELARPVWFFAFLDLAANTAADRLLGTIPQLYERPPPVVKPPSESAVAATKQVSDNVRALDRAFGAEDVIMRAEEAGVAAGAAVAWTHRTRLLIAKNSIAFPDRRRRAKARPEASPALSSSPAIELNPPSRFSLLEIDDK